MAVAEINRRPRRRWRLTAPPSWLVLVGATAVGQVAQLLWLAASSRTMTAVAFGTVLGAQALYLSLQIVVDAGSWLYGARSAAESDLSDEARGRITRVRLELAVVGSIGALVFGAVAGGAMPRAVGPYALALLLFAALNTWESFGRGRQGPYLGYIAFRSLTPAFAAWVLLLLGAAQPVMTPGLAECVTIVAAAVCFRLAPVRNVRAALAARSGPRAAIMRVSLPQIASQGVMAIGTLTLSLAGAAASAGMLGAGVKVLGGFTTLVGGAALPSFRRLAQQASARDDVPRAVRSGLPELLTTASWLSLVLTSALGLAAPILALVLLNETSDASVTTLVAAVAAMPPAAFVAALTSPLIARRREAALGVTYLTGIAIVLCGGLLVMVLAGPSAPGMAAVLTAAELAMAARLVTHARPLLVEERVGQLLLRAGIGACAGLVAAFVPALRPGLLAALLIVSLAGLAISSRRLLKGRTTEREATADGAAPAAPGGAGRMLAAALIPLAAAAGAAVAFVGDARGSRLEALVGFDPHVALLLAGLTMLALGGYVVWPSRWNVPAHIALGFSITAYLVPVLLAGTLEGFPASTTRDYAEMVALGGAAYLTGLMIARRWWGRRPPAVLLRLLAPEVPDDRTLATRALTVMALAAAGLALGFALAGFVPLFAADPLAAKLLRGSYQESYIAIAPLYRFSLYLLAALVPLGLAAWWVTRRFSHLVVSLAGVGLLLGALNRDQALTGLVMFAGLLAARRRSTSMLYVAAVAVGFPLVGASFFILLGTVFGLSNFVGVYGIADGSLNLWHLIAVGAPDVADQLTFMLAYQQNGELTWGRTFIGGLVPYHYEWNPSIWSIRVMLPNADFASVLGGVRLPAPVWGFTAFGWPGVVGVPLLSGVLLGAFSSVARQEIGRGSLLRCAFLLAIYTSVALPLSEFYFLGISVVPPLLALLWIGRRSSIVRAPRAQVVNP